MHIDSFIASQILVGIAALTDFASFQFKDRKKVMLLLCISSALIAAHYFLLDKQTAGVLIFISMIRYLTSYFSTKKSLMYALITVSLLVFALTYSSVTSFLIIVAMIIFTFGAFQGKDKKMRLVIMLGTILMITYNVIIFSPMAILLETAFLASNCLGYYRFYLKKVPVCQEKD